MKTKNLLLLVILILVNSTAHGNSIRVDSLQYLMQSSVPGTFNEIAEPVDNFEILLFDSLYGRMIPRAVFRNTSGNKSLDFTACLSIISIASGNNVYMHEINIDSALQINGSNCGVKLFDKNGKELSGVTKVPPGGSAEVTFSEFFPYDSSFVSDGKLRLAVFSKFPDDGTIGDSLSYTIEVVKLKKDMMSRSVTSGQGKDNAMHPVSNNWICKGVEVVDAWDYAQFLDKVGFDLVDKNIWYDYNASEDGEVFAKQKITITPKKAHVYCLNRVDPENMEYKSGKPSGDTMISQIIDLDNYMQPELDISLLRSAGKLNSFDRGWQDKTLAGPECRVTYPDDIYKAIQEPDKLIVDFLASNELEKVLNPDEDDWNKLPGTDSPACPLLTIFGGGGYVEGYNKDTALTFDKGLRFDPYDHGRDNHFTGYRIAIPDSVKRSCRYIRFRVRVCASKDGSSNLIKDDYDDFLIKDIRLLNIIDEYVYDLSTTSFSDQSKFTVYPKRKSTVIMPVAKFENLNRILAPGFCSGSFLTYGDSAIFFYNLAQFAGRVPAESTVFSRFEISFLVPKEKSYWPIPRPVDIADSLKPGWNTIQALVMIEDISSLDLNRDNDVLYGKLRIFVDNSIGYDDPDNIVNDVPEFSGVPGSGLNLLASSTGNNDYSNSFGFPGGNGSGQIAMRFKLGEKDTIYGFRTFFAGNVRTNEDVRFCIYTDTSANYSYNRKQGNCLPYQIVPGSEIYRKKAKDDLTGEIKYDEYVTYVYDKPMVLPTGVYWAVIGQTGNEGLNIGGSKYRMGMATTVYDPKGNGDNGVTVMVNEAFRTRNWNTFAYQNNIDEGPWVPFTPMVGNPAYSYLDHCGTVSSGSDSVRTFQRGTFVPMFRVYMDGSHYEPGSVEDGFASGTCRISPNPVVNSAVLNFDSSRDTKGAVEIRDILGNVVLRMADVAANEGSNSVIMDCTTLNSGIYFCVLYLNGQKTTIKFNVIK